jgi:hypothetical protein
LIVERTAPLHAEVLGHRDLHAFDVLALPERLEHRVAEPREEQVVNRLLSEVVVDAEDALLIKRAKQNAVEPLRRGEIRAERFFHNDPRAVPGTISGPQLFHYFPEQNRRNGEIMRRPLRGI